MGCPPLLNSLLSFFHGCKVLALPQGQFTAFAPANKSALRAQGRSRVPPAAHLLYHGKRNGFHPKGMVGGVGGGSPLPRAVTRAWTVSDRRYPFSRCPVLTSARTELPQQPPYFFGAVLVRNRNGAAVPASGLRIREKG